MNFHISKHPLRLEDREAFGLNRNVLDQIAHERIRNVRVTQDRYRNSRRLRVRTGQISSESAFFGFSLSLPG
jgi:hypothetical protein